MSWDIAIRIGHVIGTVLGVGGATFAEIFILKALADGKVDEKEGEFLKTTYLVIRIGLIILVISGFAFLLLNRIEGHEERLYGERTWSKMIITLIILINAILLQTRKVPLWLGGAISLTSWYTALVLGMWRGLSAGYVGIFSVYIAAIFIVALIQHLVRKKMGVKI